jgi:hypothetical protein
LLVVVTGRHFPPHWTLIEHTAGLLHAGERLPPEVGDPQPRLAEGFA